MEMHQIRYFLALCEELNFTKAAERCNVAQPSLTRAIKLLEDEFGGVLLHRLAQQAVAVSPAPYKSIIGGSPPRPAAERV